MTNLSRELENEIVAAAQEPIATWMDETFHYHLYPMVTETLQGARVIDRGAAAQPRYMAEKWPDPATIAFHDFLQMPSNMHRAASGPDLPRYGDAVASWMDEALRNSILGPLLLDYSWPHYEGQVTDLARKSSQALGVPTDQLLDRLLTLPVADRLRHRLWDAMFDRYRDFTLRDFLIRPNTKDWYWRVQPQFDPNLGGYGPARMKTRMLPIADGLQLELRSAPHCCEYEYLRIHELEAMVRTADNEVIGWLRGYVFAARHDDLSNQDFFYECDALNQEVTDLAHYLMQQHGDAMDIFDYGDLFYLCDWEMRRDRRGNGIGMAALKTLLKQVKRSFPSVNTLVVELAPMQFETPFQPTWPEPIPAEHARACVALQHYWEREAPELILSRTEGRTLLLSVTEHRGHEESLQLLGEYMQFGGPAR